MSASEPNRFEKPPHTPSREELAVAPTQALRPDEPSSELVTLLDGYLAELQAGRRPDREQLLAEHPELAAQLEQCLSGIEFIHRASVVRPSSEPLGQLGDFRIIREVGRGGMGVVYEAEQVSLKRRIALKVLRYGAAADSEAMKRFQREAETVATLHHTNIVPIFAIGCENGVNYYAMQFIEGRSLNVAVSLRETNAERRSTSSAPVTLEEQSTSTPRSAIVSRSETATMVANWGLQAAEALAHAHHRGVIHRDIKPSNLILDPDGRIWLTDFGLAKRMDDVSLSMAGAILGTPRYMSPEQAAASKNPVDHRTDIYSLGATLYELATGRPLFEGDSPHLVITQILTTEPPAPRVVCPNLPRDFETIIVKCLAKEPERRYATAQALADDLRAFVEGRAIRARRATLAEQAARWFKQQKRSVGVAAATVAATIFVIVGGVIAWQMREQAKLGYLTLNTPRDGNERAEVAEVLRADNDEPVGSPFTLPTKEPLALPEGAYRLRLTAPGKVSQTYLFDISAGDAVTYDVGLVSETIGHPISLRSPGGAELSGTALAAGRQGLPVASAVPLSQNEPRLFVGPQDRILAKMRCYSANSHPGWKPDGSRETEVAPLFEANWSVEAPDIISFLKLPADREAWKVLPAQTDVAAWQQVVDWFGPWWYWNGTPPKLLEPARDLNGDGVADVIWSEPQLANRQQGSFGPGPLTPKAAVLVAASGKDGKPLWWFRPQDSNGGAAWLMNVAVWGSDEVIVCALRSTNGPETWLEAVSAKSGESLWRSPLPNASGTIPPSLLNSAELRSERNTIVGAIGRILLAVDVATGKPLWPPHDLGESLMQPPRLVDLEGDGQLDVLSITGSHTSEPSFVERKATDQPQLTAMSLSDRRSKWSVAIPGLRPDAAAQWPIVVDLDGDGLSEIVMPNDGVQSGLAGTGVIVLDGQRGEIRWSRRFPISVGRFINPRTITEQCVAGPDLDGDGHRELFAVSVRAEMQPRSTGSMAMIQHREYFVYVDCFSGHDGQSVWWQRIPLGHSEFSSWTGVPGTPIWWGSAISRNAVASGSKLGRTSTSDKPDASACRLIIPVRRHADQGGDGIGNAGARLLFVLSAATGRVEQQAEDLALPQLVDWNNDGLDDLAVFIPDDPRAFDRQYQTSEPPRGKFVVLRGSPPEAFRRLDRWVEEQDFDGDGIAELSQRYHGNGDYAVQIASGRDGRIMAKWPVHWPETPRTFTVGGLQSFPPPLGDFDGDGLADLLISRDTHLWEWDDDNRPIIESGKFPLLLQAVSGKTGKRIWGGNEFKLPEAFRPTSSGETSESWRAMRNTRCDQGLTQAADLDADGKPEVLQALRLVGYRRPEQGGDVMTEHQQPHVALLDGRTGTLRWCEPISESVAGSHMPGLEYLRIDASTDLNGDGTRDLVLTVPHQDKQGWWLLSLQVHSGRDGKVLWGPKQLDETNVNNNDFNPPILSDLDGDGRPEIVLMPTKQPHVTVLRGDTGELLWMWKGSQPPHFSAPGIAVVQRSPVAPRQESRPSTDDDRATDAQTIKNADSALGNSSRGARGLRCVAVAFNETGSQWNIVLLDHTGEEIEKAPCGSNQLWSHDLDGDGGEELLWWNGKLQATRGLQDVLWSRSPTPTSYGWISHIDRTADGRTVVTMSSNDSLTLLDGPTGKPLSRSFRSTNTSLHENGRAVDLNRLQLNSAGEATRLLTRAGDGSPLLGHVVSRAVLPTDEEGRYLRSRHAPRDEPNASPTSKPPISAAQRSASTAHTAHHAERDGYVDDPRLVRQLMWAPTPAEWATTRFVILKDALLAVGLSLVVVLIPYWLIRAGVQRRDLGRWRIALIGGGTILFLACLALLRFPPPGAMSRDVPWALPFVMSLGGLPILLYPAAMLRAFANGDWRRIRWLVIATVVLSLLLGAILMAVDLSSKSPEQHYSWFGWWMIFGMGAYFTGGCLVLGHVVGPGLHWVWRRFSKRSSPPASKPILT